MVAGDWDFILEQGATFRRTFTWRDEAGVLVPLAGFQARMQVRHSIKDVTALLTLTTENGGITLTDPGVITLFIDAVTTALITAKEMVYDLEIVDPNTTPETVTRLVGGKITLSPEVTR